VVRRLDENRDKILHGQHPQSVILPLGEHVGVFYATVSPIVKEKGVKNIMIQGVILFVRRESSLTEESLNNLRLCAGQFFMVYQQNNEMPIMLDKKEIK